MSITNLTYEEKEYLNTLPGHNGTLDVGDIVATTGSISYPEWYIRVVKYVRSNDTGYECAYSNGSNRSSLTWTILRNDNGELGGDMENGKTILLDHSPEYYDMQTWEAITNYQLGDRVRIKQIVDCYFGRIVQITSEYYHILREDGLEGGGIAINGVKSYLVNALTSATKAYDVFSKIDTQEAKELTEEEKLEMQKTIDKLAKLTKVRYSKLDPVNTLKYLDRLPRKFITPTIYQLRTKLSDEKSRTPRVLSEGQKSQASMSHFKTLMFGWELEVSDWDGPHYRDEDNCNCAEDNCTCAEDERDCSSSYRDWSRPLVDGVAHKTDGSLEGPNTMEIVLDGAKTFEDASRILCETIDEYKVSVNASCGFHVHVSSAIANTYIKRKKFSDSILYLCEELEEQFFESVPKSRTYNNDYCASLNPSYPREVPKKVACHYDATRYLWVNFTNLFHRGGIGTVEFRLMGNTKRFPWLNFWMFMLGRLCKIAEVLDIENDRECELAKVEISRLVKMFSTGNRMLKDRYMATHPENFTKEINGYFRKVEKESKPVKSKDKQEVMV